MNIDVCPYASARVPLLTRIYRSALLGHVCFLYSAPDLGGELGYIHSSGGHFSLHHSTPPSSQHFPSIRYFPAMKVNNALGNPLGLQVSMGDGDQTRCDDAGRGAACSFTALASFGTMKSIVQLSSTTFIWYIASFPPPASPACIH
ncbi:hypothetical protein EVAR_16608_1 [Eumeta japonica]|uniref:Uncharacterized protein n=1 Tax=Eumeta variegata TaxID=151549 RepID=A0A4C1V191_EUMVA|nr:hypothetical protein EVAR_16608_1 [Eumeta japonica]